MTDRKYEKQKTDISGIDLMGLGAEDNFEEYDEDGENEFS